MPGFLKTNRTQITRDGEKIILKGVNLGGWLMMEGYILHSLNVPERTFKKEFAQKLGQKTLEGFERDFRNHFIQEKDFKNIAKLGFNCLRVPFNSRLIEKAPYQYSTTGVQHLDRTISWGKRYGLWIILDLHAACGAQNHDWHSDSLGKAELWQRKNLQDRTIALWEFLADRYKNEPTIAGYDLLNESVVADTKKLNSFYQRLIQAIRRIDRNHILFVEGNIWATNLDCLDLFEDENLCLSIHFYEPIQFTANFIPCLSYPVNIEGDKFNRTRIQNTMQHYYKIAQKRANPIFVGEFGINYREGFYQEDLWLKDVLECFREFEFHWTYWTYKAVKNALLPDGLFSFYKNPAWICRQGPRLGWDHYKDLWPKYRKDIIRFWQTEEYKENTKILKVLKQSL